MMRAFWRDGVPWSFAVMCLGSLLGATIGVAAVNSLIDVDFQWCREVNAADVLFERVPVRRWPSWATFRS